MALPDRPDVRTASLGPHRATKLRLKKHVTILIISSRNAADND